jgi:hypothetical protein
MGLGFQDVLATAMTIAALVLIVRRVVGAVKPASNPACANCPIVKEVVKH